MSLLSGPYVDAQIFFLALQWVAVLIRMFVRMFMVRAFGKDDVATIVTLIFASGFTCCYIAVAAVTGLTPLAEFPSNEVIPSINLFLSVECLYIVATACLKVALGLLLLRVLVRKWMVWVIYSVMAISVIYGIAFFLVVLFQCGNPRYYPEHIVFGQCFSASAINGLSYVHAILQAGADIVLAILALIFICKSNFTRRTKVSVGAILVLGSAGCVCTFLRIGWIHYLSEPTATFLVTSKGIALMSTIELSTGLVCLSLATYKPLLNHFFPRQGYYYYSERSITRGSKSSGVATEEMAMERRGESANERYSSNCSTPTPETMSTEKVGKTLSMSMSMSRENSSGSETEIADPQATFANDIGRAV